MFEAVFILSATVKRDESSQILFQVHEDENPTQDFLSPLAMTYYQDVYKILQAGDTLTVTIYAGESKQSITTRFREGPQDYIFEEAGFAPCYDLFPLIEEVYREMIDLLQDNTRTAVAFQIQRP